MIKDNPCSTPVLIRKRFIPFEEVDISKDEILELNDSYIVTRWKPIRLRKDMGGGVSCIYIKDNMKISGIFDSDLKFKHWYCDIVKVDFYKEHNKYVITDLMADVIYIPGEEPKVLDLEELDLALEEGFITVADKEMILGVVDRLLALIKKGDFPPNREKFGFLTDK